MNRTFHSRPLLHALLSLLLISTATPVRADVASADLALQSGRAAQAKQILTETLDSGAPNSKAHQLLCRLYYAEQMPDAAIRECSAAVGQDPADSNNQMWLGRAYGLKAAHSNPIAAYQIAKKVRAAFERAVQLDPTNVSAFSDLGEFYVDAPSMLGGGLDKAEMLANGRMGAFPSQAHRLLALAAVQRSDLPAAEQEFKASVAISHSPESYVDLANFYEQHDRFDEAVAQVQAASAADHAKDAALVDAASILISAKRRPDLAEALLRQYLASKSKSDAAPAFQVHVLLGKLLSRQNDTRGAQKEFAAALELAPDFEPAQKALRSL